MRITNALLHSVSLAVCFSIAAGCSSGGGGGSDAVTVNGTALKGPVKFADVDFYVLNVDGTRGALIGSTLTTISGSFDFVSLTGSPTGCVLAEVTGGTYFNATDTKTLVSSLKGAMKPIVPFVLLDSDETEIARGTFGQSRSVPPGEYTCVFAVAGKEHRVSVTVRAGEKTDVKLPR